MAVDCGVDHVVLLGLQKRIVLSDVFQLHVTVGSTAKTLYVLVLVQFRSKEWDVLAFIRKVFYWTYAAAQKIGTCCVLTLLTKIRVSSFSHC